MGSATPPYGNASCITSATGLGLVTQPAKTKPSTPLHHLPRIYP